MADIIELEQWEAGIYQLEQEDLVLGGPDGIDNLQAKQLANRTKYLKALVEALGTGKQPIDAMLTALAALATADGQMIYFTGPDAPALTGSTVFGRALLAAGDTTSARALLDAVSPTDVAAAVAALVDASPAALDTLNELAAALGDDPNFAATITNALALKAPLSSPALTGAPTAPSPAQFDASTRLATTEFVKASGVTFSGSAVVNAAATLGAAHIGNHIYCSGAGGYNVNLPLTSTCRDGDTLVFECAAAGGVTIFPQAPDLLYTPGASSLPSVTLALGDTVYLARNSAGYWIMWGGSAALKHSAKFAASIGANGYQILPSGRVEQWGSVLMPSNAGTLNITYPIAMPLATQWFEGTIDYPSSLPASAGLARVNTVTQSGFSVTYSNVTGGATYYQWRHIGR